VRVANPLHRVRAERGSRMPTAVLHSIPGRLLRIAAGLAIVIYGAWLALPLNLVAVGIGAAVAARALADRSLLDAGGRPARRHTGDGVARRRAA
jgi:hypothetical protein